MSASTGVGSLRLAMGEGDEAKVGVTGQFASTSPSSWLGKACPESHLSLLAANLNAAAAVAFAAGTAMAGREDEQWKNASRRALLGDARFASSSESILLSRLSTALSSILDRRVVWSSKERQCAATARARSNHVQCPCR